MSRNIPAGMATHLVGPGTTTCIVLKIRTADSPALIFGITNLDKDIAYDDGSGDGEILYKSATGFDPSTLEADTSYSVANAEVTALVSAEVDEVTTEFAQSGGLDDAQWIAYQINYRNTANGHIIRGAGDVGEVRTKYGMVWIPELLDYIVRLRQPIGGVWSLKCRAMFGTPADSPTGCGVDITALWRFGTVSAVGAEEDRVFFGDDIVDTHYDYSTGRIQFLTGANAGREYAIETTSTGGIELLEPTQQPIQVGDTYRRRPDCHKRYLEDCIGIYNNGLNFKGEPNIPVGDNVMAMIPASQTASGKAAVVRRPGPFSP